MEDESPTPASPELDGLSYPPSTNKAAPAPSSAYPAPSYHASPSLASRPKNATLDTRISEDSAFDDAFIHVEDDDDALLVRGSPTRGFRGYSAAEDPEGSEWIPPRPRRDLRNTILLAAVALVVIVVVVYYSLPSSQAGGGNGSGGGGGPIPPGASPVLLISLDGFRPRYLSPENTPNLLALAKTGAIADSMSPVFPSVTFANHYSIATGLWPESHGIVGNIFKAPDVKDGDKDGWFDHGPGGDSRYWFGEPIWTTVEFNGLPSAAVMFPGSQAPHGPNATVPTHLVPFNAAWSSEDKISKALEFLALPEGRTGRPVFTALYISDVDTTGHMHGPYSTEMNVTLQSVDKSLGNLFAKARQLVPSLTIVIVSDHGMAQIENNETIALDDYVDLGKVDIITHQPIAFIEPKNASETQDIYQRLLNASQTGKYAGKWQVWLKPDIPAKWHYSNSPRIPPIVALPVDGWVFVLRSTGEGRGKWIRGTHGFDPDHPDMAGLFMFSGPSAKTGVSIPGGWRNIEIYDLLCRLIWGPGWKEKGWKTAPTNGTDEGKSVLAAALEGGGW